MALHIANPRDAALGAGLMALALAVIVPTARMPVGFSYDGLGPRAFPYMIAGLMMIGGLTILVSALQVPREAEPRQPVRWGAVALISVALLAQIVLIRPLGWIPTATLAFLLVAWAFGSRQVLVSILFGAILATATFVLFNYGLRMSLPGGVLSW